MGLPTYISTIRITSAVFFLLFLFETLKKRKTKYHLVSKDIFKEVSRCVLLLLVYSFILLLTVGFGKGDHIYMTLINALLFSTLVTIFLVRVYDSIDEFMKSLLLVTIIQSIFIWLCTFYPSFGQRLDSIFLYNYEHENLRELSYAYGLACTAAPGAIKYCLGLISCLYFYGKNKKVIYIILFIAFVLTGTMMARTSLIFGVMGLAIFPVISGKRITIKNILSVLIPLSVICLLLFNLISNNANFFSEQFSRLLYLFDVGFNDAFLKFYLDGQNTVLPPISSKTIIGTGISSGLSENGVYVNTDGGYLKNYVALGLIASALFYIKFFLSSIRLAFSYKCKANKALMLFFVAYIFLAEFKEWVVFGMYLLCVFYTVAILLEKQEKLKSF